MFGFGIFVLFLWLMIITDHPVVSFKTSECAAKCSATVWKNTLHSEKVKLYNLVMPIFVLAAPRDLKWYLKPNDEEIDQYNTKRYTFITDDQLLAFSTINHPILWPMINELFGQISDHHGLFKDSKKIHLIDFMNTISANLTVANTPMLFQPIPLHYNLLLERITLLKEFLSQKNLRRIPDCVYKVYYYEVTCRLYVEKFVMDLLDHLETNANKINNSFVLSTTDSSEHLSNLNILNCWSEIRRDILVLYDLFDGFEKALQILKTSDENYNAKQTIFLIPNILQ